MSQKDYKMLRMVTADNNNKYYEMIWNGGDTFTVKYGRVESTATTIQYPHSQWHKKYSEKVNKGYRDVTDTMMVQVTKNAPSTTGVGNIADKKVEEFMLLMKRYTDNLVTKTYSVKADNVTQKQVDDAQKLIDGLKKLAAESPKSPLVEKLLVELYTIIPRKMRNVKDHLPPKIKLDATLEDEQDNLDAMASQVKQVSTTKKTDGKQVQGSILDTLGVVNMIESKNYKGDIGYLLSQQRNGTKIEAVFELSKPTEDKNIKEWMSTKKNKTTKILIHGTRCSSVLPILEQGLKIRPSGNFQFSGKAYGDGNYFSEVMQKSLNYTGIDNDKVLLVYEVHTGNPFVYDGWFRGNSFPLTLKELEKRGYDSTYVKAGHGLLNTEIIAYSEKQNRIKYIIWLK